MHSWLLFSVANIHPSSRYRRDSASMRECQMITSMIFSFPFQVFSLPIADRVLLHKILVVLEAFVSPLHMRLVSSIHWMTHSYHPNSEYWKRCTRFTLHLTSMLLPVEAYHCSLTCIIHTSSSILQTNRQNNNKTNQNTLPAFCSTIHQNSKLSQSNDRNLSCISMKWNSLLFSVESIS